MFPWLLFLVFLLAELAVCVGTAAGYLLNVFKVSRLVRRWLRSWREKRKRPKLD